MVRASARMLRRAAADVEMPSTMIVSNATPTKMVNMTAVRNSTRVKAARERLFVLVSNFRIGDDSLSYRSNVFGNIENAISQILIYNKLLNLTALTVI